MFRLENGRSYARWYDVFATVFFGGFVVSLFIGGRPWWVFLTFPVTGVLLLISQLRSGVALDGAWRASYVKGTWQIRGMIVALVLWAIYVSWLVYYVMTVD